MTTTTTLDRCTMCDERIIAGDMRCRRCGDEHDPRQLARLAFLAPAGSREATGYRAAALRLDRAIARRVGG